ncbi:unnamed protein product [Strongylus vulgaris]|uniref:Uncharacterized protein n=1 Tax=Strongylus vulgaris TaxID=40348 RepID=A0A3P7IL42_STRVU|nr:unnamed protein product [Strongylus vulgaris]
MHTVETSLSHQKLSVDSHSKASQDTIDYAARTSSIHKSYTTTQPSSHLEGKTNSVHDFDLQPLDSTMSRLLKTISPINPEDYSLHISTEGDSKFVVSLKASKGLTETMPLSAFASTDKIFHSLSSDQYTIESHANFSSTLLVGGTTDAMKAEEDERKRMQTGAISRTGDSATSANITISTSTDLHTAALSTFQLSSDSISFIEGSEGKPEKELMSTEATAKGTQEADKLVHLLRRSFHESSLIQIHHQLMIT